MSQKARALNLDLRQVDSSGRPFGWHFATSSHYDAYVDTSVRKLGYNAVYLAKKDSSREAFQHSFGRKLPLPVRGDTLEFSALIKTEHVTQGHAGLIAMLLSKRGEKMAYKAMVADGLAGTQDWTRRSIRLPIDVAQGDSVYILGILAGNGRAWIGNMEISVDGRPLSTLPFKPAPTDPKSAEGLAAAASPLLEKELSPVKIQRLADLGMLWGFLKYYHPAIEQGRYDWDSALFRILPAIVEAPDEQSVHRLEERWVRQLGNVPTCGSCAIKDSDGIRVAADYGYLFDKDRWPESMRTLLARIRDNHHTVRGSYYVTYRSGLLEFIHEERYSVTDYPSTALRLLCLYRYWSMVQYYFPYRNLITEDWNKMLAGYLPRFIGARHSADYALSCLELIGHLHDTHANVWNHRDDLDSIKGRLRAPFEAVFAEKKLVVTKYLVDSPDIRSLLPLGAVVMSINGVSIDSLVHKYLPLTPASNETTQLRDLPTYNGFLLRSNRQESDYVFEYHDSLHSVRLPGVYFNDDKHLLKPLPGLGDKGFDRISPDIGYIRPDHLSNGSFNVVRKALDSTRGIIIDLRHYPSPVMNYNYGSWLKSSKTPFALLTGADIRRPGCMSESGLYATGGNWFVQGEDSTGPDDIYKGHVILLVNAWTQSKGEFTTMALQSAPRAMVIGSTTAGADGNICSVSLPGNIFTDFSGIGVYYPDGGGTQRVGVRIDRRVEPTVKGLREGRDELLEEGVRLLKLLIHN